MRRNEKYFQERRSKKVHAPFIFRLCFFGNQNKKGFCVSLLVEHAFCLSTIKGVPAQFQNELFSNWINPHFGRCGQVLVLQPRRISHYPISQSKELKLQMFPSSFDLEKQRPKCPTWKCQSTFPDRP